MALDNFDFVKTSRIVRVADMGIDFGFAGYIGGAKIGQADLVAMMVRQNTTKVAGPRPDCVQFWAIPQGVSPKPFVVPSNTANWKRVATIIAALRAGTIKGYAPGIFAFRDADEPDTREIAWVLAAYASGTVSIEHMEHVTPIVVRAMETGQNGFIEIAKVRLGDFPGEILVTYKKVLQTIGDDLTEGQKDDAWHTRNAWAKYSLFQQMMVGYRYEVPTRTENQAKVAWAYMCEVLAGEGAALRGKEAVEHVQAKVSLNDTARAVYVEAVKGGPAVVKATVVRRMLPGGELGAWSDEDITGAPAGTLLRFYSGGGRSSSRIIKAGPLALATVKAWQADSDEVSAKTGQKTGHLVIDG